MDTSWPVATPATLPSPNPSDVPPGARCGVHDTIDATFLCVVCGTYGCTDCAFATGERGITCKACAARGLAESVPWERRAQIGWVKAFWETTKLVCKEPKRFFSTPSTETGLAGPVMYAVAVNTVGTMMVMITLGLALLVAAGGALIADQREVGAVLGIYGGMFVCFVPFSLITVPLQTLMNLLIAAACTHGSLMLLKSQRATFEQTLRAISYAHAPLFWLWVPCAGWYLTTFWVWGVEAIALRETHRTTTDRAVLAAIGYRILFGLLIMGLYAVVIGGGMALGFAEGSRRLQGGGP